MASMRLQQEGLGIDRHLFGLTMAATELGEELPELLTHPAVTNSSSWRLSTSHLGNVNCKRFGYCPVVEDGIGLG